MTQKVKKHCLREISKDNIIHATIRSKSQIHCSAKKSHATIYSSKFTHNISNFCAKGNTIRSTKNHHDELHLSNNSFLRNPLNRVLPASNQFGTIEDCHRKKKNKCARLPIIISVSIVVLLIIIALITLLVLLIKLHTKQKTIPTSTNLRWNETGETIAGITGLSGIQADRLNLPFDVAIDFSNTLYISDMSNNRVQRWLKDASSGTTVCGQTNGTWGANATYLKSPAGIAIDTNNDIYIADSGNARIQYWPMNSISGITLAGNGTVGNQSNQLSDMYGFSLDSGTGTLYIADYFNHRIMRYVSGATSGTMVAGTGVRGKNSTQLYYPSSVYFDSPSNSLTICNTGAQNIVRWTLGASYWTLVAGNQSGFPGSNSTFLNSPFGLTMDPMGNVYVADLGNIRIQFFLINQFEGITVAGETGILGNSTSLLNRPYSVRLDNQLNLYVVDTYNHRIQRFLRY